MPGKGGAGKQKHLSKKAKKKASWNETKQLEAQVHTSLPPLVRGVLRGHLRVYVEKIVWEYSLGPPTAKLCVRLKWWGEATPGTVFRVPVFVASSSSSSKTSHGECTTLAYYPIRSGPHQLKAYLKDMGPLCLQVGLGHMTDDSMIIGQSTVPDLSNLSATAPMEGLYPVVNSDGIHLGKLQVRVSLELPAKDVKTAEKQTEVQSVHPEFIVGPGATLHHQGLYRSPERDREVDTVIGYLNQRKTTAMETGSSPRKMAQQSSINTAHGSTSATASQPSMKAESSPEVCRRQQIEVISELIEQGRKLREAMVQSVLDQPAVGSRQQEKNLPTVERESDRDRAFTDAVLSVELAQKEKERKALTNSKKHPHKQVPKDLEHEVGISPVDDHEIVGLLVGGEEPDLDLNGLCVELSSEEEEGLGLEEDFSMNESDYPLRDESLLQKLLYSEPGEQDGSDGEEVAASMEDPGRHSASPPPADVQVQPNSHPSAVSGSQQSNLSKPKTHSAEVESGATSFQSPPTASNLKPPHRTSRTSSSTHLQGLQELSNAGSWSTLSSLMGGRHDRSLESAILRSVGMEKLTRLGRVTSARVVVENLQLDTSAVESICSTHKKKVSSRIPQPSTSSATYFVEYQFPAIIHRQDQGRSVATRPHYLPSHEVMRVASKKMKGGTVQFSHRSVFPVVFNSRVIQQWWGSILTFRVYCRPPTERMPFLVGKAVVPLRQWLEASSLNTQCRLDVRASSMADAVRGISSEDPAIGKLQVSLQLVVGKKQHEVLPECQSPPGRVSAAAVLDSAARLGERESDTRRGDLPASDEDVSQPPVKLKEKSLSSKDITQKKPPALQLLLLIPEGMDITVPTTHSQELPPLAAHHRGIPNCYLVCKLFCASPHPQTPVQWAASVPQFGFKQVYPLYLTPSLLDQVCNNFAVVEVWHKTPGATTEDELVGLVKLSLHQFYLAFSEESSTELCREAELPVIAVDSYCPIVNPFTGVQQGYLAVLLAMGTANQVTLLQQQFAAGSYLLQQPHTKRTKMHASSNIAKVVPRDSTQLRHSHDQQSPLRTTGEVHHVFELTVEGIRSLSVFSNTVWGEADCFVQYHFPTASQEEGEEEEGEDDGPDVSLQPYRTGTTLCVPNPAFSHETRHTLTLPSGCPVQRELMTACGSGGIPFELWRRFYYPNIRDQLIARGSFPLVKLCAMVTMQRMSEPTIQSFSLPLKVLAEDRRGDSGGLLDIAVRYEALSEITGPREGFEKTHVNLSVGILRATGLKDAAVLAATEHPVPLGFAAEVGVNAYAQLSIPSLPEQDKRTTKTIARSFAPEFSHFFDVALPLVLREQNHPQRGPRPKVPLAEKLSQQQADAVVEVWHQVPKMDSRPHPVVGRPFGRRLGPTFRDVLLGSVEVPLVQLLQKHTGIRGWFALCAPRSSSPSDEQTAQSSSPTSTTATYVGAVELSFSFANEGDRKLVVSHGIRMGWKAPKSCSINLTFPQTQDRTQNEAMISGNQRWRFEICISGVWLPLGAVAIPTAQQPTYKYCFLRYRFFEKDPVVTVPRTITYAREGVAYYQLKHKAQLETAASPQLQWYASEESLEVQVWASVLLRGPATARPQAEDALLGSASVPLGGLLGQESSGEAHISGYYPLFKPGVDSLGSQTVHIEVRRTTVTWETATQEREEDSIEILDSSSEQEEDASPRGTPHQEAPEGEQTASEDTHPPSEGPETFKNMFEARIVVHQALHLPMVTDQHQQEEWPPSAYVTVHPHPSVEKITTPVVSSSQKPLWGYQCLTHIPNLYLQSQCSGLEFQVWNRLQRSELPAVVSARHEGSQDSYIGCAHVDLSPLACGLSQICGWYNVVDFGGQIQGQLKISVVPSQRLSFCSRLLSYPLHFPPPSLPSRPGEFSLSLTGKPTEPLQPKVSFSRLSYLEGQTEEQQLCVNSSSMLFRQLRENIQELDRIHQSLQAKLKDTEEPTAVSLGHPTDHGAVTQSYASSFHHRMETQPHMMSTVATTASYKRQVTDSHLQFPLLDSTAPLPTSTILTTTHTSLTSSGTQSPPHSHFDHLLTNEHIPEDEELPSGSDHEGSPDTTSIRLDETISLTDVSACSRDGVTSASHSIRLQVHPHANDRSGDVHIRTDKPLSALPVTEPTETDYLPQGEPTASLLLSDPPSSTESNHSSSPEPPLSLGTTSASTTPPQEPVEEFKEAREDQPPLIRAQESPPPPPSSPHRSLPQPHPQEGTADSTHPVPATIDSAAKKQETAVEDSTLAAQKLDHLHRFPAVRLPNFFMPPQDLEQSMRSLRATVLSRPPPRELFQVPRTDNDSPHSTTATSGKHSTQRAFTTVQEVNRYLESRRADRSPQHTHRELSAAETQRIARIFSLKPSKNE